MTPNRKVVQELILERIHSLTPKSDKNRKLYEERFSKMSDLEFSRFIDRLEKEEEILTIISPNLLDDGLSIENNLKIADKIGHKFFTRIMIVGKEGVPDHLTPIEYMVIDLPVRRVSQTSDKKIKVPKNNKVIDSLTGQVTGESRGGRLTGPELQILSAMGMEASLIESMKYRGGDMRGRAAFNGILNKYGYVSLKTLDQYASGVESTNTVKTFLTAMHLKNTL